MQIVNGYVCQCCSDVALAQKGIDPAQPQDNPQSPQYNPQAAAARRDPAVVFAGALAGLNGASQSSAAGQQSSPFQTGSMVDLSA
jgi:hypothetical protein